MQKKKSILIVMTKAPYGTSALYEALDFVLAAGTFDQQVQLLITEDACFLAIPQQRPELIHRKNSSKTLNALPLYGIEGIFMDVSEAMQRGIEKNLSALDIQLLNSSQINKLYQHADIVIRF